MQSFRRVVIFLLSISFLASLVTSASSDAPRDADAAQSGYVGGDHNIGPETASRFQHLWNITFKPDEKVETHLT